MQEINLEFNEDLLKKHKEIISFKCELHENLQQFGMETSKKLR